MRFGFSFPLGAGIRGFTFFGGGGKGGGGCLTAIIGLLFILFLLGLGSP